MLPAQSVPPWIVRVCACEPQLTSVGLFWSDRDSMYCDFGSDAPAELTTERTQLRDGRIEETVRARLLAQPKEGFVCHEGYISVFPFLLDVLPHDSGRLQSILRSLSNRTTLMSPYDAALECV